MKRAGSHSLSLTSFVLSLSLAGAAIAAGACSSSAGAGASGGGGSAGGGAPGSTSASGGATSTGGGGVGGASVSASSVTSSTASSTSATTTTGTGMHCPCTQVYQVCEPECVYAPPPMPTARSAFALATATNGKLYAIGGWNGHGSAYDVVEIYDPTSNAWSAGAPMPTARNARRSRQDRLGSRAQRARKSPVVASRGEGSQCLKRPIDLRHQSARRRPTLPKPRSFDVRVLHASRADSGP